MYTDREWQHAYHNLTPPTEGALLEFSLFSLDMGAVMENGEYLLPPRFVGMPLWRIRKIRKKKVSDIRKLDKATLLEKYIQRGYAFDPRMADRAKAGRPRKAE
jgi:hypothetical protein